MLVMRCPKCQAVNCVQLEACGSCGAGLWPEPWPEQDGEHNLHVCVAGSDDDESFRGWASRFLRRFFGAGASA